MCVFGHVGFSFVVVGLVLYNTYVYNTYIYIHTHILYVHIMYMYMYPHTHACNHVSVCMRYYETVIRALTPSNNTRGLPSKKTVVSEKGCPGL